jgi:hypothetical protein
LKKTEIYFECISTKEKNKMCYNLYTIILSQ